MLLTNWLTGLFQNRSKKRHARRQNLKLHTSQLVGQTELLEDRTLLSTFYVDDVAGDFTDGNGGPLNPGDPVTWNPTGNDHPAGTVGGLIFGTNAFLTIQDAIAAAAPTGDTILVAAGEYTTAGAPGNDGMDIAKSVTIIGAGANENPLIGTVYAPVSAGGPSQQPRDRY